MHLHLYIFFSKSNKYSKIVLYVRKIRTIFWNHYDTVREKNYKSRSGSKTIMARGDSKIILELAPQRSSKLRPDHSQLDRFQNTYEIITPDESRERSYKSGSESIPKQLPVPKRFQRHYHFLQLKVIWSQLDMLERTT